MVIDKHELRFAMREDHRNGARIEACVDGIYYGSGERYREVEFIHGGNVWGDDGNNLLFFDSEV